MAQLDTILRSISHDFKEPLRSIRWYLQGFGENQSIRRAAKSADTVKKMELVVRGAQENFETFYISYKQTADPAPFRAFVRGELKASVDNIVEAWPHVQPLVSHIRFAEPDISVHALGQLVHRVHRRYLGLLEYLELNPNPVIARLGLHNEVERVTRDIVGLRTQVGGPHIEIHGRAVGFFDPALIGLIFQNLMQNSIKYQRPEAALKISIRMRNTTVSEAALLVPARMRPRLRQKHGECVYVLYEDNARGIPKEYIESVFEPFVQVPSEMMQNGSGMGLAIVRSAVDTLGGVIHLESKPGTGSNFFMLFPQRRDET